MSAQIADKYIKIKFILRILPLLILGVFIGSSITAHATDYSYVEGTQTVNLSQGIYTIEVWGSKGTNGGGGDGYYGGAGGNGGYAKGTLVLGSSDTIYIIGTSGTETVRLNTNTSANNLLIGGAGGNGGDAYYDYEFEIYYANGYPGTPGSGSTYTPLVNVSSLAGGSNGTGFVRITPVPLAITISSPSTNQLYSAQVGYKTLSITGKVAVATGGAVTVSATVNGKTKSQVVNPSPITIPGTDNFMLTWDIATDAVAEGSYSNIPISGDDGLGGTQSTTLGVTLTVDKTAPAISSLAATNIQSTYINVQVNASDINGPLKYLYNIGGVDQGTWQSLNVYSFSGLTPNTAYAIKCKVMDGLGNISTYSSVLNATTLASNATNYYFTEGTQTMVLNAGTYQIEAWGSRGADGSGGSSGEMHTYYGGAGGNGGYAKGTLVLGSSSTLYIVGTSGTETVRLNVNASANNLLIGGAGGNGGDAVYDYEFEIYVANGSPGTQGSGATYVPLTNTSISTGVNAGVGFVRITIIAAANQSPTMSIINPTVNQSISTSGIITISGLVTDPDPSQTITITASINSKIKQTTVATPATNVSWGLSWTGNEIGIGSYPADITVTASDGTDSVIAMYTGDITITAPSTSTPAVTTMTGALVDITNNGDGRDLRVMFKGAPDESKIVEYRIYAVKTSNTAGFDEATAAALPTTQYMREPVKGKLRLHLTPLPQALMDSDGLIIKEGINYTVFVLSYAKTGNPHKLTSLGTITLDGNVPLNKLQAPLISDTANYGDGRDITVTFRKPINEADIKEYWIFAKNNTDMSIFGVSQANANSNHYVVTLNTAGKTSYSVKLIQGFTDIAGGPIANNQQYKVYILIVMNKASTSNILSLPSKPLKLLATVPSALPVRNLTSTKIGSGHAGTNISVIFSEPLSVTNIQEYRIFISTGAGSLDAVTASGLDNTRYIKVDSTGKGAAHTVALTGLNNIYDGTALTAGDYKVYVLTVGKTNTYANRLAGPSRLVKLD